MKLKYYLRGIGIGIIFSAIVFSISLTSNKAASLSDEEIMKKARELGMVYSNNNDDSLTLNDLLNTSEKIDNEIELEDNLVPTPTIEAIITPEPQTAVDQEQAAEPSKAVESMEEVEPTKEVEPTEAAEPTKVAESSEEVEPTKEAESTEEVEPTTGVTEYASITVTKGMSSESVAKLLENEGVISDSKDFNLYLKKHGYSKRINIGTYKISKVASYNEIAIMITMKR